MYLSTAFPIPLFPSSFNTPMNWEKFDRLLTLSSEKNDSQLQELDETKYT